MFTMANNSGKRKMKEVGTETGAHKTSNLFNLPLNGHGRSHSKVQQILNTAAPIKPFSFMSLLAKDDHVANIKNPVQEMDHILLLHRENLRHALHGVMEKHYQDIDRVVEERAAKKLKEMNLQLRRKSSQNEELERLVELYKGEAERLQIRIRFLERAAMSLQSGLQDANAARRYAEADHDDAESSFEDPDRVDPVRLDCKVCLKKVATVMMWPCRHVCVCTRCEAATKYCPVCRGIKTTSVEICLPLN